MARYPQNLKWPETPPQEYVFFSIPISNSFKLTQPPKPPQGPWRNRSLGPLEIVRDSRDALECPLRRPFLPIWTSPRCIIVHGGASPPLTGQ